MIPVFSQQLCAQPNSDWSKALQELKTIVTDDLFHQIEKTSDISDFVKRIFCRYPVICGHLLLWQTSVSDKNFPTELQQQLGQWIAFQEITNESIMSTKLRVFRRTQAAVIALLELQSQLSIESSCLRISVLAESLIQTAYQWSYKQFEEKLGSPQNKKSEKQNLIILSMGKLGGQELNFSSDVDLIFFYPQVGHTHNASKPIENLVFFRRLSHLLIQLLDEVTEEGFVYRIDMRLRPYGNSGAIVMSYAEAEDYYQEQGREWERFALLRARPITGSVEEQKALDDIIRPFSFRRYIDYSVFESIRNMKSMIQREIRRKGLKDNIKLGAGGIREIEFSVQSLQLIQGGRDPRLREKNTLRVLPLLVENKLLSKKIAKDFIQAYRFLRRVEHCLQEFSEQQTQTLPTETSEKNKLYQVMGFKSWVSFIAELSKHQQQVQKHFKTLFSREKQDYKQDDFYQALADGYIDAKQLISYANKNLPNITLNEEQGNHFILNLENFLEDNTLTNLSSRGEKRLKLFFPHLLATCLSHQKPATVLKRSLNLIQAILNRTVYLELLSENPPVLRHLVDLTGASSWITKRLIDYPILLDELLYPNSLYQPLKSKDLKAELHQLLLRVDPFDEELLMDTLRTFKQTNELRIAAALLTQRLSISEISRYLTQLAEVILAASLELVWPLVCRQYGNPENMNQAQQKYGFAIIGYGKLGGHELGFGSDLDLVFLFNQALNQKTQGARPISYSRFYARLAQKLIHFLSTRTNLGVLYQVDTRLRPSGASGLIVSHLEAYHDYQLESAWTWEHQALVRARFITGDPSIEEAFYQTRLTVLTKERDLKQLKFDIKDMRKKMRYQFESQQPQELDLKQASGGLIDIEFIAQFFALTSSEKKGLPHNTVKCLKLAMQENRLTESEIDLLIQSYRLFRNQLNELTLLDENQPNKNQFFQDERGKVQAIWQKILGGK